MLAHSTVGGGELRVRVLPLGLTSMILVILQGEMLGNFPQALTHLSLISAAFNLDRLLNQKERSLAMAVHSDR